MIMGMSTGLFIREAIAVILLIGSLFFFPCFRNRYGFVCPTFIPDCMLPVTVKLWG